MPGDGNLIFHPQPVMGRTQGDSVEVIDPSTVSVDVMDVWFAADVHLV